MNTLQHLSLSENLLVPITDLGFETPSEVQFKTIPIFIRSGLIWFL